MPVIDKFDMKFDSSASDNIRAIWSYTLALLQTSKQHEGNHPGLIIFDEPTQHSIGADDAKAFFEQIIALQGNCQIIIGITVNTEEIKSAIENLDDKDYKYIHIGEKAFV
jgi:superfamily II DNA or RNA helicase